MNKICIVEYTVTRVPGSTCIPLNSNARLKSRPKIPYYCTTTIFVLPLPKQPSPHPDGTSRQVLSAICHRSILYVWGHRMRPAIRTWQCESNVRQMAKSVCIHPSWAGISTVSQTTYKAPMSQNKTSAASSILCCISTKSCLITMDTRGDNTHDCSLLVVS